MYNLVACKVCYHVLAVTFPMPHDRGCEIKIIVIVIVVVIVKTMLLPYPDMGHLFFSSQTIKDLGKLDMIMNTALRLVYGVWVAREVHTLDL